MSEQTRGQVARQRDGRCGKGRGETWRAVGRAALAAALGAMLSAGAAQAQPAQAPFARAVPAGTAAPRAVTDLASAVAQTAAVVEATVAELHHEYNDAEGPWTRVVLSDVKVHRGVAPKALELWQFGGVLPNGRLMVAAELPVFSKGQRYVLFLRNTAWNVSPVVGPLAFRVENVDGAEALVSSDGQALIGLGAQGPAYGAALFEPAPYSGAPAARLDATASATGGPAGAALTVAGDGVAARPMDRARLLAALTRVLDTQHLAIAGTLRERPAGGFSWRGQSVARHGQAPADGVGAAGRDTSGGAR